MSEQKLELALVVKGEIVESNWLEFEQQATAWLEGINFELETDDDFSKAEEQAKGLKKFEDSLNAELEQAFAQMDAINALYEGAKNLANLSREKRLKLSKLAKDRKDEIKADALAEAIEIVESTGIKLSSEQQALIYVAGKGKRSLKTYRDALLGAAQKIADETEGKIAILEDFESYHGNSLLYSRENLLGMPEGEMRMELEARLERRRQEEEKAKLKAEAEAKAKEAEEARRREAAAKEAEEARERLAAAEALTEMSEPRVNPALEDFSPPPKAQEQQEEEEQSDREELAAFVETLKQAFSTAKSARQNLKHERNKRLVAAFAESLTAEYQKLIAHLK